MVFLLSFCAIQKHAFTAVKSINQIHQDGKKDVVRAIGKTTLFELDRQIEQASDKNEASTFVSQTDRRVNPSKPDPTERAPQEGHD